MNSVERDPLWPAHWDVARLGDITARITSGSRDWKPYYERGRGVFILTQNVRMGHLDVSKPFHVDPPEDDPARARSAVEEGDLLVTIVGANVGNVARVPKPLPEHYVCQSLGLIRPADVAASRFLELFLMAPQGGQKYFEGCYYGQGRPHLSFADIKAMPVPLPPLDEQQRIVSAAESHFAGIANGTRDIQAALSALPAYRRAVLQQALEGPGTEDWPRTTIDSVGRVQLGRQRAPKYHAGPNMRPYLRVANVFEDRLDLTDVMEMDFPPRISPATDSTRATSSSTRGRAQSSSVVPPCIAASFLAPASPTRSSASSRRMRSTGSSRSSSSATTCIRGGSIERRDSRSTSHTSQRRVSPKSSSRSLR